MTIGGSFTVNIVHDGAQGSPVPSYNVLQYAWSASVSTSSPSIAPSDPSQWSDAIPQSVSGKPYLWLKTEKWDWQGTYTDDTPDYTLASTTYARLSGENGTGIQVKGSVATANDLPSTATIGDAYYVDANGHLYVWNGTSWTDVGEIKGEPGMNSYVHLAWAHAIGSNGYPTNGMGFTTSKEANENFEYMGVLVDHVEIDSQTPSDYSWNRINGAVFLSLDNDNDVMLYSQGSRVGSPLTSQATLYVGGTPITQGVAFSCTTSNATASVNISTGLVTVSAMTSDTGWVLVTATYNGVAYSAKMSLRKSEDDKYEIIPSARAIAYNQSTDTPSSVTLSFKIRKSSASGESIYLTSIPTGMALSINGNGIDAITPSHASGTDTWSFSTDNSAHDSYVIELKKGNIVEDMEEIPLIKASNGDAGNDAVNLILTPSSILAVCTSYGDVIADQDYPITASVNVGGTNATVTAIAAISQPSGIDTEVSGTILHIQPQEGEADNLVTGEVRIRVTYTYDGIAGYTIIGTIVVGVAYNGANGKSGENSIRLDLDNENDSMQYASSGTQITQSIVTHARLYDGHTLITSGVTWTHTAAGVTVSAGSYASGIKTYTVSAMSAESGALTIKATYNSKEYSSVFSVKKLVNQDKYQLQLSPSTIAINTDEQTTPSQDIKVGVIKYPANGGAPQSLASLTDNLTLHYTTIESNGTESAETQVSLSSGYYTIDKANINIGLSGYRFILKRQGSICDSETIPIAKVVNGKDNIYADLSNEMDSVPMDSEGNVIGSNVVTTGVAMYFGSTLQTLTNITWVTPPSGVTVAKTPTTGTPTGIKVTIANGTTLANDKVTIALTAYATINGQSVAKTLDFTIQGVRGGANGTSPIIYQLNPSDTTIRKAKDGTISPSSVSCGKLKRVGNNAPIDTEDSAVRIFYQVDGEASEHAYVNPINTSTVESGIRFTLYQGASVSDGARVGGTLIDVESIPVVEDGQDGESIAGENSVHIDLDNEMDAIQYSDNTKVGGNVVTHIRLYDGASNISNSSDVSWSVSSREGCSNSQAVLTNPTSSNNYATMTVSGMNASVLRATVTIKATYNGNDYFATFTVNKLVNQPKYELHVTPNALSYNITEQTSNNDTIVVKVYKTEINGTQGYVSDITNNFDIIVRGWDGSRYYDILMDEDAGDEVSYIVDFDDEYLEYDVLLQDTSENYIDHETIPVVSVRNGSSMQVQYAPNPSSSQIHTTFQDGDLYMRTKLSTSANWGSWLRIVGESGGETDYQFGISAQLTTANAQTAPTLKPNTSWSDAPIPTEADYPYLWTMVQRKNGDGSNDGTPYYIRMTGEASVTYSLESTMPEITIPSDTQQVTPSFTVYAYKKEGNKDKESVNLYFGWWKRKGTTYTHIGRSPSAVSSRTISNILVSESTIDAIEVFVADSLAKLPATNARPSSAFASITIPIHKQGDTGNNGEQGEQGEKGDNAITYRIEVLESRASISASGKLNAFARWQVWKNDGGVESRVSSPTSKSSYVCGSITSTPTTVNAYQVRTNSDIDGVTISGTLPTILELDYLGDNTVLASAFIPISVTGQMGRNYYFAGEYSSSELYELTDYSAPFVSYTQNGLVTYWVLTGENGKARRAAPSSATGNPWRMMEDSFKYLITEAILTNFAKLGSAIFNKDYMFSQEGYIVGFDEIRIEEHTGEHYQYLDVDDIDATNFDDSIIAQTLAEEINTTSYQDVVDFDFENNHLTKGRWYTISLEIEGTEVNGDQMQIQLWDTNGTARGFYNRDGAMLSTHTLDVGGTGTQKYTFLFKEVYASNVDSYRLMAKMVRANMETEVSSFVAPAKFTPTLYMNLFSGQMVANNLTARGTLYASSVGYSQIIGTSNNDTIYVDDASFVCLSSTASGSLVILPNPTTCKGRVIELFAEKNNATYSWRNDWVGRSGTSYFKSAWGGTDIQANYSYSGYTYIKFFSDGTDWYILRKETT